MTLRKPKTMDATTYSDTRANLKEMMERVVSDRTPAVITHQKVEAVVVVSLADWTAVDETLHLLSSPANADRMRASIRQLDEKPVHGRVEGVRPHGDA